MCFDDLRSAESVAAAAAAEEGGGVSRELGVTFVQAEEAVLSSFVITDSDCCCPWPLLAVVVGARAGLDAVAVDVALCGEEEVICSVDDPLLSGGIGTLPVNGATSIGSSPFGGVEAVSGFESSSIGTPLPAGPLPPSEPLPECACDWWYLRPLMWRYFFEQFGSGHSINGAAAAVAAIDWAAVMVTAAVVAEDGGGGGVGSTGLDDPAPRELDRLRLLLDTSSAGVFDPFRLAAADAERASLAGLGGAGPLPPPLPPTRLPFAPLRSLLCIGLDESIREDRPAGTGVDVAPRPRLARPFGARDSASLVGESQNL